MPNAAPESEPPVWASIPPTEADPGLLQQGEVHLCLMPLARTPSVIEELAMMLTPDEHERASRFYFDRDRRRFIVARGLLRQLLGRYLGAPGDTLRFAIGPFGKPHLAAGAEEAKLEFSLSHSGDWALAGITRGREIGVDLEEVRTMTDHSDLARSNFAPAEVEALLKLPEAQQMDGFFACWTLKEAYVKALGLGLSLDLASFAVSVEPTEVVEVVPASQSAGAHHMWGMRPRRGFWAAVAIETSNAPMDFPRMRQVTHPGVAT